MKTFAQFIAELQFADLKPRQNRWMEIPITDIHRAKHTPSPNLDDELFDLIQSSYAYVGGYPDFKRAEDLPANHTVWYGIDVDGDTTPDALSFGKETPQGFKWTGLANDGTPAAKRKSVDQLVQALKRPGNYGEFSDAIMHILITRYQVPVVDKETLVQRILKKPILWVGKHPQGQYPGYAGFYRRRLFGEDHLKIMLGTPNAS